MRPRRTAITWRSLALLLLSLVAYSCGYVGDPLPPALNIPTRVNDLKAHQRGDRILVSFTVPSVTTEGLALKLGQIELRAGSSQGQPFDWDAWLAQAHQLDTAGLNPGPAQVETSAREWAGKEVFLRVRVFSRQGRDSGWSDFAILRVLPPLNRSSRPVAEAVREGVRLTWQVPGAPAGVAYRIYRRSAAQESASVIGTSGAPEFLDTSAEFGKAYEYTVQAAVTSGQSEAESEISESVSFTPVDRFPPAVPAGLSVLAGTGTVELVWERNQETDLRGYRIYRAAGDGPMQSTSELIDVPSYSDGKIESGKRYRYAVTAVDQLGNESAPSSTVEITVP